MIKTVKKRFDINITQANVSVSGTFELEKNIVKIHGLLLTSDKDDLLYYRGSQKIEINKEEIFPDSYESKLLMSGINVAPKQRYYDLGGISTGNGRVQILFKDTNDVRAAFVPYRVSVYLDCEMTDNL